MSEELEARSVDRGLVRIMRTRDGRSWAVTARIGDTAEELRTAYENARSIELLLRQDDPPARTGSGTSEGRG